MNNDERIKQIEQNGVLAQGRNQLIKHLRGGRLTVTNALKAHCYECLGYYADGKRECACSHCALYPFMPYNPNRRKAKGTPRPGQKPPSRKR